MPPRLNLEDARKIFADAGCWLVADEYLTNKKPLEYICVCHIGEEDPPIYEITLQDIQRGGRCKDCRDSRTKETLVERYNVTHMTQIKEKKEQMLSGITKYVAEKKHKLEDLKIIYEEHGCKLLATEYVDATVKMPFICVCGKEYENNYSDFKQGQRCAYKECVDKRKAETYTKKYGTNQIQTEDQKKNREEKRLKYINTCQKNYQEDHPMQNIAVLAKNQKYRFKNYTYPSGNIVKIQGYENLAVDLLLKTYKEEEIITERELMPEIYYHMDLSWRKYIPDIYIPKDNLIIEVKSTWTYKLHKYRVHLKNKAVKSLGYNIELYIFSDKGVLVNR